MRIPIALPKSRALLDATNDDDDDDDAQSLELNDVLLKDRQSSSRTLGSSSRHSPGSFANVSWSSSWHSSSSRVLNSVRQSVQSKMRRPIQRTISVKSGECGLDVSPKKYSEFNDSLGDVCFNPDDITTLKLSNHTGMTSSSHSFDPSSNKSESDDEWISPHRSFNTISMNEIVTNCLQLNLSDEHHAISPREREYTISNPSWMSPMRDTTRAQTAFPSLSTACDMEMKDRRNLRLVAMDHAPLVVEHHSRRSVFDHQVSSSPQTIDRPSNLHPATRGEDFAFDAPKPASFRRKRADIHRTPRRKVERNLPKREIAGEQITLNSSWHAIQRPFSEMDAVRHSSPRRRALNPDAVLSRVMATPGRSQPPRTRRHGLDIKSGSSKNLTSSSDHVYANSVAQSSISAKDQMERISPRRASGFYSKRERVQFDFDLKDLSKSIKQTPKLKASLYALKGSTVLITKPLVDLQSAVDPAVFVDSPELC